MYNLYSDFDIHKHAETYINYLEVIILPSGKVEYAIPSHQETLINIGAQKFGCSRDEFISKCPVEFMFDYTRWLCDVTQCVAVWNNFILGTPNRFQKHKLKELYKHKLYKGTEDFLNM